MNDSSKSPADLQRELGDALRNVRISKRLLQTEVAAKAGIALKSLVNLERGYGSSVETLVRTLNALDLADAISRLAPQPQISPMALLRHADRTPQRVRRRRSKT